MPSLSKYKTLGKKLGEYKRTVGKIGGLEYSKEFSERKGERQRAMYGQIGASIGSIIGLAGDISGIKEQKQFEKDASSLPGIITEKKEYQPLGKFGERIGLDKRTKDVYKSAYTGRNISPEAMRAIGYQESIGIETKYSDPSSLEKPGITAGKKAGDKTAGKKAVDKTTDTKAVDKTTDTKAVDKTQTVEGSWENLKENLEGSWENLKENLTDEKGLFQGGKEGRVFGRLRDRAEESALKVPKAHLLKATTELMSQGTSAIEPATSEGKALKHQGRVEDGIISSMKFDYRDMFQIPSIKAGMSDFERNIAKSENMAFWESGGAEGGVYSDTVMATGEVRPASGFGTALQGGETSIEFGTAVERMRGSISVSESGVSNFLGEESWNMLSKDQRGALTEIGYIMGVEGATKNNLPKMFKAIKDGNMELANQEAMFNMETGEQAKWISQIGKKRSGRILSKLFPEPYRTPRTATSSLIAPNFLNE